LDSKVDEKNNDLIKTLKERIDLGDQLNSWNFNNWIIE
jgi:hypothetical protein